VILDGLIAIYVRSQRSLKKGKITSTNCLKRYLG